MKPVEDAAGLDHARIGVDVRLRRIGNHVEIALLRLEHLDVLKERGSDLLDEHVRGLAVVDVPIVRLPPEIMAGGLGFRRDGVEVAHAYPADAPPFGSAGTGWRCTDIEPQKCGRREINDLPAIDIAGKAAGLHE